MRPSEQIAHARFRVYGTSVPPDATFTLRLNFGTVQGWKEDGHEVEPFTYLARLFERATGQDPFRVPDSWLAAKSQLDLADAASTSPPTTTSSAATPAVPLLDAQRRHRRPDVRRQHPLDLRRLLVRPELNRAVAVDPAIMLEGLRKVYKADELLAEMGTK